MAHAVLLLRLELGGGEARRELEDRVEAEAAISAALGGHRALDRATAKLDHWAVGTWVGEREPADHPRAAIADSLKPVEQDARVVARCSPSPPRRSRARPPVQGSHLDAGVIGQGKETRCPTKGDGLVPG